MDIQYARMADLGDSFSRGMQIAQQRQNMAQMRFEQDQKQKELQKQGLIKQELQARLQKFGSASEALKNIKTSPMAGDIYPYLVQMAEQEYKLQSMPIDMETARMGLQAKKNEQMRDFGAPLIQKYLEQNPNQGQRIDSFEILKNQLKDQGLEIPNQWIDQGYTPEVGNQLSLMAAQQKDKTTMPMSVQEYEYWNALDDASKENYMRVKRAQQLVDLGGSTGILNPITNNITTEFTKTAKPLEESKLAISQEELRIKQEAEARAKQTAENKPLSGDAAKVMTIAETMPSEIDKLIVLYKKDPKKTLLKIKTNVGEEGRLAQQIADKVGRLRSGGAVNRDEEKRFLGQVASWSDVSNPKVPLEALESLKQESRGVYEKMGGKKQTQETKSNVVEYVRDPKTGKIIKK